MSEKDYSFDEIVEKALEESRKAEKELGQCNVLIIGKTGVGKSTLINNVFKDRLADTGVGRPITTKIFQYNKEGCPITVYDTPGLELSDEQTTQVTQEVNNIIKNRRKLNIQEHIHVVWYCVNNEGNRLEEKEELWIQDLSRQQVPVILVLTQTNNPKKSELLNSLESKKLPVNYIIPILAEAKEIDENYTVKAYGLERLVEETAKLLPAQAQKAFIHQQIASINLKAREANKYVIAYVTGSGVLIGANQIPFADAPLLLQLQVAMLTHITVIFGLKFDKEFFSILLTAITGVGGTGEVGKTIVRTLISWIPGANLATGVIAGATAATMTLALGLAYIEGIKLYKESLANEEAIPLSELAGIIVDTYKNFARSKQ